jgi:hypothetical protein
MRTDHGDEDPCSCVARERVGEVRQAGERRRPGMVECSGSVGGKERETSVRTSRTTDKLKGWLKLVLWFVEPAGGTAGFQERQQIVLR